MSPKTSNTPESSSLLTGIQAFMLVGAICIVGYSYALAGSCKEFLRSVCVSGGLASAAIMLGGLLGFLFSIPRAGSKNDDTDYPDNSNLVDISDWLTKILVGAGLVTLAKAPPHIQSLAEYLAKHGFANEPSASVFVVCLLLWGTISAFLWVYVWTRLNFPAHLSAARAALAKEVKEAAQEARESPTTTLLLRALALPPSQRDAMTDAIRKEAEFTGRTELRKYPTSRKLAILYSRVCEEQFSDLTKGKRVLEETLHARRQQRLPGDGDDAALLYNLACYTNKEAKQTTDHTQKEKLRTQAIDYLKQSIKLDPQNDIDRKSDSDLIDLQF